MEDRLHVVPLPQLAASIPEQASHGGGPGLAEHWGGRKSAKSCVAALRVVCQAVLLASQLALLLLTTHHT